MKTTWKRLLSLALCLVMCLTLLPNAALADDSKTVISTIVGTSNMTAPTSGGTVTPVSDNVVTLSKGSPAYVQDIYWQKRNASRRWVSYTSDNYETFQDGTYRMRIALRIDGNAFKSYAFSSDTSVTIDGAVWTLDVASPYVNTDSGYTTVIAYSPLYYVGTISEIQITSNTTSVTTGELPTFTATTSTANASIEAYGSNTNWNYYKENVSVQSWHGFGSDTPTAVNDGVTHYGLNLKVSLSNGYSFDENTQIYFNGVNVTSVGNTGITKYSWGGYVTIDLGKATDKILSEIRITSNTTSVTTGKLPAFTATTSTANASIEAYGSNTCWSYIKENVSEPNWHAFGSDTPTAVNDGVTHYGLKIQVTLSNGYLFGDETQIYFNGINFTSAGYTAITKYSWGGYVYIDLGKASENTSNEIRITSKTTSVTAGELPAFTASTSTAYASIEAYGSNTNWNYLKEDASVKNWYGFGGNTPTAVNDGVTHYGLNLCVDLSDGHSFDENTQIYFNGINFTSIGYTSIKTYSWGGYVTIDLGKATDAVIDPCADYIDIDRTKWYHEGIDFVISRGLMKDNGYVNGKPKFDPNANVTRAMVAMILYRMAGNSDETVVEYQGTFTDVPEGKWYTAAVEWCAQNGLAEGRGDGTYDPNGNVTRQELALFMMRMAGKLGKDTTSAADLSSYPDAAKVASWAKEAMSWAVGTGLITGDTVKGVDYLAPTNYATRAQLATILMRYVNNIT